MRKPFRLGSHIRDASDRRDVNLAPDHGLAVDALGMGLVADERDPTWCESGGTGDAAGLPRAFHDIWSIPADVLHTPYLPSPCVAGLRRPAVLLPEAELSLSTRDVLIHELAHLQRRDCHWNLLRKMATAVFLFQPLLWRLSDRLEMTAEEVCDDFVVQYGSDRAEYASRLVDVAEFASAPMATAAVAIVSLRSMLARRVTRIMDTSRNLSTRVSRLLVLLVLIAGFIGTAIIGLVGAAPQRAAGQTLNAEEEVAAILQQLEAPKARSSGAPPVGAGGGRTRSQAAATADIRHCTACDRLRKPGYCVERYSGIAERSGEKGTDRSLVLDQRRRSRRVGGKTGGGPFSIAE